MPFLKNFPNYGQLDDQQEANREYDCVPTAIADSLSYFTGKPFDAAQIKDAVYGAAYTGGTDATKFVDYCASAGVTLAATNGDGYTLVKIIQGELAAGRPVMASEPDPYLPPGSGWSHAICFYGYDEPNDTLTARDPYSKNDVMHANDVWASLLQFNQVWTFHNDAAAQGVPHGWSDDTAKGILTAPNGITVRAGFRQWVLSHQWDTANWPLEVEHGRDQLELSNPSLGGGTQQRFRLTTLEWTKARGVFVAWTGPELIELEHQLALAEQHPALPTALKQQLLSDIAAIEKALQATQDTINS